MRRRHGREVPQLCVDRRGKTTMYLYDDTGPLGVHYAPFRVNNGCEPEIHVHLKYVHTLRPRA